MPDAASPNLIGPAEAHTVQPAIPHSVVGIKRSLPKLEGLYANAGTVRSRYDNISDMTVYRWLRDPRVGFPAPVYIGRRRYWKVADLIAWEQARANAVEVS